MSDPFCTYRLGSLNADETAGADGRPAVVERRVVVRPRGVESIPDRGGRGGRRLPGGVPTRAGALALPVPSHVVTLCWIAKAANEIIVRGVRLRSAITGGVE